MAHKRALNPDERTDIRTGYQCKMLRILWACRLLTTN